MNNLFRLFTQSQLARLLVILLLLPLLIGLVVSILSLTTWYVLIMLPVFGFGLYLYLGYLNISQKAFSESKSRKYWNMSAVFNASLIAVELILIFHINYSDSALLVPPLFIQSFVLGISLWAKKCPYTREDYESRIAEIGTS